VGRPGALGSVWSHGNRNPQGLAFHPVTAAPWETERGPRGGDELNRLEPGKNNGWPVITRHAVDALARDLRDRLLHRRQVLGLAKRPLHDDASWPRSCGRLVIEGDRVTHQEFLVRNAGRVREVAIGPDGYVYVTFNDPGRIVRLVPADSGPLR
jgi:glucose/arabinose dehydrogenase